MASLSPPPNAWATAELQEVRSNRIANTATPLGRRHRAAAPAATCRRRSRSATCTLPQPAIPCPCTQALAGQYYVLPWRGPLASMGRSLVRSDGTWLGELRAAAAVAAATALAATADGLLAAAVSAMECVICGFPLLLLLVAQKIALVGR